MYGFKNGMRLRAAPHLLLASGFLPNTDYGAISYTIVAAMPKRLVCAAFHVRAEVGGRPEFKGGLYRIVSVHGPLGVGVSSKIFPS
jgi:hypothetical protein